MKALIVTRASEPDSNDTDSLKMCIASLQSLGIQYKRTLVEAMPADSIVNGYDFIVMPTLTAGFATLIDDANITIPMFGLDSQAGAVGYGTLTGVTSSRSAVVDHFVDVSWESGGWLCPRAGGYDLGPNGTALMTASTLNKRTGLAQSQAGKVFSWSQPTGSGSKLYTSSIIAKVNAMLSFLIQHAINDGTLLLSDSNIRRAPVVVDIDHINSSHVKVDATILDKIASYVPSNGILWCGIFNNDATVFENMPEDMKTRLLKYQAGPFKYGWHDHTFDPLLPTSNLDDTGHSTDHSKADMDTLYTYDEGVWNGHGLVFHTPAYYNVGSNSWDESMLELFSSDETVVQSPGNDTVQAGRGFTAFRTSTAAVRNYGQGTALYTANQYKVKRKCRGIQILHTQDMALNIDMPYDTDAKWRNSLRYITNSLAFGSTMFFHPEDFVAADQDPSVDQHGYVVMQQIVDVCAFLKDLTVPFADPTNYVTGRRFR